MSSGGMSGQLPDRAAYRRRWSALHGGYDPSLSKAADGWLTLVEAAARPLARRRVAPASLTAAGVFLAAAAMPTAAVGGRWSLVAGAAVAGSGLLDGLDGSVAVLTGQASPWGSVLDSLADRLSDAAYLVALRLAGASRLVVQAAAVATVALEYSRARAAAAGLAEIGVVTVGERPMRLLATCAGLAAAGLRPPHSRAAATAATAAAVAVGGLAAAGTGQFLRVCGSGEADQASDGAGRERDEG
jgi:CDP-diacylglycerol--glycerol-3-phosphate 3-phosphatidyltransferase